MAKKITTTAFEKALQQYSTSNSKYDVLKAKLDAELNAIRAKYATDLESHIGERDEAYATIEQYADQNRETLFTDGKKSTTKSGLTIGYRSSKPSLVLCEGISWDEVVANLKKKKLESYLRVVTEVDANSILKDREDKKLQKVLPAVGLEITQGESFYVKPVKEAA